MQRRGQGCLGAKGQWGLWGSLLQQKRGRLPAGNGQNSLGGLRGSLPFLPQIDWGDFTLEPSGASDGTAAGGGAQDEIDWGITLEPSPQVTSGHELWPCWGSGGVVGAPPHWVPSVLQQDDGIDWGDGESDGAQISVLEAGTEGEHGHKGAWGSLPPRLQCPGWRDEGGRGAGGTTALSEPWTSLLCSPPSA